MSLFSTLFLINIKIVIFVAFKFYSHTETEYEYEEQITSISSYTNAGKISESELL
jgi:hypothetical protein